MIFCASVRLELLCLPPCPLAGICVLCLSFGSLPFGGVSNLDLTGVCFVRCLTRVAGRRRHNDRSDDRFVKPEFFPDEAHQSTHPTRTLFLCLQLWSVRDSEWIGVERAVSLRVCSLCISLFAIAKLLCNQHCQRDLFFVSNCADRRRVFVAPVAQTGRTCCATATARRRSARPRTQRTSAPVPLRLSQLCAFGISTLLVTLVARNWLLTHFVVP